MRKHDPALHRHSIRVGRLATDYSRFLGMDYERGWNLIEGALLHDVGKICLPVTVLTKPRNLNEEEKRMLALHPVIGAELLSAQGYFAQTVVNIVLRHHERLDGSGYPGGWRKQRTAKLVRVVALCDALCAMTEDRPYEDAWPWEEALDRLQVMSGQYDPEILSVLRSMIVERGTSIQLHEGLPPSGRNEARKSSDVQRPRSAFFAPRSRHGVRLLQ